MKSRVVFADEKLKRAFHKLKDSKTEDRILYKWLNRAFDDLRENLEVRPTKGMEIDLFCR